MTVNDSNLKVGGLAAITAAVRAWSLVWGCRKEEGSWVVRGKGHHAFSGTERVDWMLERPTLLKIKRLERRKGKPGFLGGSRSVIGLCMSKVLKERAHLLGRVRQGEGMACWNLAKTAASNLIRSHAWLHSAYRYIQKRYHCKNRWLTTLDFKLIVSSNWNSFLLLVVKEEYCRIRLSASFSSVHVSSCLLG